MKRTRPILPPSAGADPTTVRGGVLAILLLISSALGPASVLAEQSGTQNATSGTRLAMPGSGKEAISILSLLDYQFAGCSQLSDGIVARWDRMAGSDEHQEQRIRDWILQSHTGEIASFRLAGDLADELRDRLLPNIRRETGASLRRMARHTSRLCDLVAVPVAPFDNFRLEVLETVEKIEREVRELGRLVLSDDRRKAEAIAPYLPAIQMAAVEAEGEYHDFLATEKPKEPEGPTMTELMQHWHQAIYLPSVLPAKRALAAYLQAQAKRNRGVGSACRDLSRAVVPILNNGSQIFSSAPDPQVTEPLRQAYVAMQALAFDCNAGRVQEAQAHLSIARRKLALVASLLAPHGITP